MIPVTYEPVDKARVSAWLVVLAALAAMSFLFFGCASPAEDYVRAEASAWAQIDDKLDAWIDAEPSYTPSVKGALHMLNKGRRARVAHAIAAIESGE